MNKPFKTYPGGKAGDGVYQSIINRMPYHDIYIELFLGGGSIFAKKKLATYSILIDIDDTVTGAWGKIQIPAGVHVINADAISFLRYFAVMSGIFKDKGLKVFIYADPPYPIFSRGSQRSIYTYEMTNSEHVQLLQMLAGIDVDVMVSSYPNRIYDKMLADWHIHDFTAQTRNKQRHAVERVYMNYPTPTKLHDYKYLGDTYRDRERLRGIVTRTTQKLIKMPAVERNALLQHLKENNIL